MADPKDILTEAMVKKLCDDMDEKISREATGIFTTDIWQPEETKQKYYTDKWQRDLFEKWDKVSSSAADPVQRLRKEMHDELRDIKKAINKIGIMLDSDAPSQEQLDEHTTLREAYRKYKMIEALTLGKKE